MGVERDEQTKEENVKYDKSKVVTFKKRAGMCVMLLNLHHMKFCFEMFKLNIYITVYCMFILMVNYELECNYKLILISRLLLAYCIKVFIKTFV